MSSANQLSMPNHTVTRFVPVGRLVVFVSTSVPFKYVSTLVPLLNVILYVFRLVYVAVIAEDTDVVVPSAVLTNTVVAVLLPACKNTLLCTDVISVHQVVAEVSANHTEKYLQAQGERNAAENSISKVVISSHLKLGLAVFGFPPIVLYTYQSEVNPYVAISYHPEVPVRAAAANDVTVLADSGWKNTSYCLSKLPHTKACVTAALYDAGVTASVVLVPVIVSASVAYSVIPLFVEVAKSGVSNTKFVPS